MGCFHSSLALGSERRIIPPVHMSWGTCPIPEPPETPLLPLGMPGPRLHTPITPLCKALWPPPGGLSAPLRPPLGRQLSVLMPSSRHPGCWERGYFSALVFLSPRCVWVRVLPVGYGVMAFTTMHAYLVAPQGSKGGHRATDALPPHCPTVPLPLPGTGLSTVAGRRVPASPGNLRAGRPHCRSVALLTRSPSGEHALLRKSLLPRRMLGTILQTASCSDTCKMGPLRSSSLPGLL